MRCAVVGSVRILTGHHQQSTREIGCLWRGTEFNHIVFGNFFFLGTELFDSNFFFLTLPIKEMSVIELQYCITLCPSSGYYLMVTSR